MKVAICQTSPVLLDLKANLEDVVTKIHHGREQGAQLIVFPELALTGYSCGDLFYQQSLLEQVHRAIQPAKIEIIPSMQAITGFFKATTVT